MSICYKAYYKAITNYLQACYKLQSLSMWVWKCTPLRPGRPEPYCMEKHRTAHHRPNVDTSSFSRRWVLVRVSYKGKVREFGVNWVQRQVKFHCVTVSASWWWNSSQAEVCKNWMVSKYIIQGCKWRYITISDAPVSKIVSNHTSRTLDGMRPPTHDNMSTSFLSMKRLEVLTDLLAYW